MNVFTTMQTFPKSCRHLIIPVRLISSISHYKNELRSAKYHHSWCTPNIHMFSPLVHNTFNSMLQECMTSSNFSVRNHINFYQNFNKIFSRQFGMTSSNYNGSNNSGKSDEPSKKTPNDGGQIISKVGLFLFIANFLLYVIISTNRKIEASPFISWNEFVHKILAKGEVAELIVKPEFNRVLIILHDGAVINNRHSDVRSYQINIADVTSLEEKLREAESALGIQPGHGIPVNYERDNTDNWVAFVVLILTIALYLQWSKTSAMPQIFTKDIFGGLTRAKYTLVDPLTGKGKGVKFSDVAGLKEAKIEVMEFVDYLKRPEHYKILGAKVPKGALLLGPPGCGKTMLAKAVATEAYVPFLSMNGSEFIEMIGGLGAARVRNLFKEARNRAPSILYIDEIDAIGKKRATGGKGAVLTDESEHTLNQLLVEMDGMASKEGVIVLASTNRAEVLDKALLRPGRFDRHILIDLPTLQERKEIFERYLRSIVLEEKPEAYSPRLAQLTPGFSGADIANVCNEAALHAATLKKKLVDASDLSYSIDKILCGPEKRNHGVSPAEKQIVAYHEAGHALVAWMLEHTDALLKVTIKPRTTGMLGFAQYAPTERRNFSKEELFQMMCVALGGRVAESLIFNQVTTGAQNDLEKVTKIAYSQIRQFGMGEKVGLVSFAEADTGTDTKKPYSKKLGNLIDAEARLMVAEAYTFTETILKNNMDKLEKVAEALLKQETLTYEEVENLIGAPPFGNKKKVEFFDIVIPTS